MLSLPFRQIVLFEDDIARSRRFLPLTYTRSTAELRTGAFTTLERVHFAFPGTPVVLHTSLALKEVSKKRLSISVNALHPEEPTLFINSRAFLSPPDIQALPKLNEMTTICSRSSNEIIAAFFETVPETLIKGVSNGSLLPHELFRADHQSNGSTKLFRASWEMVHYNSFAIKHDIQLVRTSPGFEKLELATLKNVLTERNEYIHIHPTVRVGAGVVLDATDGPILIEAGVRIMPNATIMGPVVIGKDSIVKVGAKIYEGTTVGPMCKVGGEIEESIILGYSNKQHDGFLGHSYLGQWVNLGADTNTSDLKNDYSTVKVTIEGEEFDTSSLFIGLLMGDHSKSAINTQFNTGTAVGVSANIFESGFPPKWIPNFTWCGAQSLVPYRFDKAIKVARTVMERRKVEISEEEIKLLRELSEAR